MASMTPHMPYTVLFRIIRQQCRKIKKIKNPRSKKKWVWQVTGEQFEMVQYLFALQNWCLRCWRIFKDIEYPSASQAPNKTVTMTYVTIKWPCDPHAMCDSALGPNCLLLFISPYIYVKTEKCTPRFWLELVNMDALLIPLANALGASVDQIKVTYQTLC